MVLLRALAIAALVLSVSSCKSAAAGSADARAATDAWLALVDAGHYAQSWTEAASFFKGKVDSPTWEKMVTGVRAPMGKVLSRTLKSATPAKTLPGVPDGDYVVFQFDTAFEHKPGAVETVTPMKDTDGDWRVSGYYIK